MKISKKIVSLLLCMTMLVSATAFASMTSAPQTDAKDLVFFSEGFTSSGLQTMTYRGKVGSGDASAYYSLATFTPTLKNNTEDDYYMNLGVSKTTNTSSNNSAGFRKSTSLSVSGGLFSISYDIRFNTAPTSGVLIKLTGETTNAAGTSGSGLNRSIIEGVADNTKYVGLWDQYSDNVINIGTWYTFKHFFNTKTGYEYMTATDPDGNSVSITPQSISDLLKNVLTIKNFTVSCPADANLDIDNIVVKDESVSLEMAADTFLDTDDVMLTATIPDGFDKAVVMVNGDVMGQIAPVAGKNVYDITIPASELGLGNHELILSASYSDGITRTNATTVTVVNEYETNVSSTNTAGMHPTEVDDFDYLWKTNYVLSDGKQIVAYNYIQNNTKYWQSNEHSPALVRGASGADDDYAIAVAKVSGLLQIKALNKPILTTGKLVIEFDMLIGADTTVLHRNNTDDKRYFISSNKIFGAIAIEADEWTHVKLIYDTSDSSFVAIANGHTATSTKTLALTDGYVRFTLTSGTMFAIDNSRIYNLVTDPVINSAAYVTANGETETTGAIPADATAIKLNMSEALDVTSEDVIIWADGEYMQPEDVSSADGVVTITLPELEANTDLTVVLADTIDGVSAKLSHNFYVTDSGSFFKTAGVVTSGNTATAVIRHMGSGTNSAIVAAYNGNQLVSINVCDFKSAADIGAVNVSASTAGADEIKIMAWNTLTSATPKMTATSYPIN